jgi:hypothetical protein
MSTAIWTVFAGAAMVGIFAGCVMVVAVGVRVLENVVARRRQQQSA